MELYYIIKPLANILIISIITLVKMFIRSYISFLKIKALVYKAI
jgi:hypothetical protein